MAVSQGPGTGATALGRLTSRPLFKVAMAVLSVLCAAPSDCGGGGGAGIATNSYTIPDQTTQNLTGADVDIVVRHAINEATARGKPATIAVVDRLGNVLGVVQMAGAPCEVTITSNRAIGTGLEDPAKVVPANTALLAPCAAPAAGHVPATLAAIAKAITGAFLSSGGNAFSTRTASQIVQEHFNPGIHDTPGGPLFGVQFSQLPCSDFNEYLAAAPGAGRANAAGPQRSPLGLSADPGGMPIYKQGVMVGGIGVVSKPSYSLDANIFDFDQGTAAGDNDEIIAIAGLQGFEAPQPIQAQNISAGGVTLRYSDASAADLAAAVALAPEPFGTAAEVNVTGYYTKSGAPLTGKIWGTVAAGVFPDAAPTGTGNYPGVAAWAFLDPTTGIERAPRAGLKPAVGAITGPEAQQIVLSGLQVAFQTRGQIRIPTNSNAEISITVVDLDGNVLAQARTPDAPVFGADVSIQKARSVVYFSRTGVGSAFNDVSNIANGAAPVKPSTLGLGAPYAGTFADYVNAVSLGGPSFNAGTAFSDRALGDLARPFYPDGIDGTSPGPLSLPYTSWSPFSDGLQLDLIIFDIANYGLAGNAPPAAGCGAGGAAPGASTRALAGGAANAGLPTSGDGAPDDRTPLADGLQIFPGGVPLYRNGVLVGAVGVSGDGVQQDDMVSYLAIQNLNGLNGLANAASNIRADQLSPGGAPLSYIICPFAPFLTNRVQNAC